MNSIRHLAISLVLIAGGLSLAACDRGGWHGDHHDERRDDRPGNHDVDRHDQPPPHPDHPEPDRGPP